VLDVPALAEPHLPLTLLRCARCASLIYDRPGIRDFSDLGATGDGFSRFYAEVAGGVWETIWPLLVARGEGGLLDVGCGYGFALDFWQRTGRGEAVGVELASYGAHGADALGVTIHRELFQACTPLRGRRFDIVYASEVIEHVEAPRAFAALLAQWVADDGVLIMTTPAAEFVAAENVGATLLTALAPGFHGFLLSAAALEQALHAAGFAHVEVRRFHERQIAWASQRPLVLDFDEARMRGACFDYMTARLNEFDPGSPVGLGYAYRLLRDYTNTGRFTEAHALERRLREALRAVFGPGIDDVDAIVAGYAGAESIEDLGRIGPYFLPGYLQFAGTLAQHVDGDHARARTLYRAAAQCARDASRVGIVFFGEAASIYWPARIADAVLGLALGDDGGAATLVELAAQGARPSAAHAFGVASPAQIESLLPSVAEELAARGHWPAAGIVADAYARYVDDRHGEGTSALAGIARLGESARGTPADPVFPAYFSALRLFQSSATRDAGRAALLAFAEAAERVRGAHAARAHALAAKARQVVSPPKFSFEMSFDLTRRPP
jgi:SAM-dependent methyltransferase